MAGRGVVSTTLQEMVTADREQSATLMETVFETGSREGEIEGGKWRAVEEKRNR